MKTLIAGFALVLSTAFAPAFAADIFTLQIPVAFSKMNGDVKNITVSCSVAGIDLSSNKLRQFGTNKSIDLPLTNGTYTGPSPVTVVFKTEDFSSQDAIMLSATTHLSCTFYVRMTNGALLIPKPNDTAPMLAHQPGTAFNQDADYAFPKK